MNCATCGARGGTEAGRCIEKYAPHQQIINHVSGPRDASESHCGRRQEADSGGRKNRSDSWGERAVDGKQRGGRG